jgi:hypothetical protein
MKNSNSDKQSPAVPKKILPKGNKKATDKKTPIVPNRKQEFELYCIWKSLPPMLISSVAGATNEIIEKLRIDDPVILELSKIRTQKDFAKKFDLDEATLSGWNMEVSKRDTLADIRTWAKKLTKNVMFSMYNNAMAKGGTSFKDRENFLKVIEQWSDKLDVKHEVGDTLADILRNSLKQHGKSTASTTANPDR